MVVQIAGSLLLTAPLITVLLLELKRLHLRRHLLNLLPQLAYFWLESTLHILLDSLCRALALVWVFGLVFHPLDFFTILSVAFFEIRGADSTILQGEFKIAYFFRQLFNLTILLACRKICAHSFLLDFTLHLNCNHRFFFEKCGNLLCHNTMFLLQCYHLFLLFFMLSLHSCQTFVNFKYFAFGVFQGPFMLMPFVLHDVWNPALELLVHLVLLLLYLHTELLIRLDFNQQFFPLSFKLLSLHF